MKAYVWNFKGSRMVIKVPNKVPFEINVVIYSFAVVCKSSILENPHEDFVQVPHIDMSTHIYTPTHA